MRIVMQEVAMRPRQEIDAVQESQCPSGQVVPDKTLSGDPAFRPPSGFVSAQPPIQHRGDVFLDFIQTGW
ncbi:hypothetical protein [Streptomyces sp. NPDC058964]|uniref:hypothetical protein n=1 Tax=Streptomyces sp. NPDC058964 TaxID=3346681 RepID=UPI0036A025B4